jgi:23S rRNA (adenine1618-N6)-methyltransferase
MQDKKGLHPRNIHNKTYDFIKLTKANPELQPFVKKNQYDNLAIDFSNPKAVLHLNKALLASDYNIKEWSVPEGHLCPPIPGRADYIHYIADLLGEEHNGIIPIGTKTKGLDIGTGTSCIYPILGHSLYGWRFIGSDISSKAINHAKRILKQNPYIQKNIKIRFQKSSNNIFKDLIKPDEKFDFTMCNPPFYSSLEEAKTVSARKTKNLNQNKIKKGHISSKNGKISNFGGIKGELWCSGGEVSFIEKMIKESSEVKSQCRWFTTLVSNKDHLESIYKTLNQESPLVVRTIKMSQGKKVSHILAWKF